MLLEDAKGMAMREGESEVAKQPPGDIRSGMHVEATWTE